MAFLVLSYYLVVVLGIDNFYIFGIFLLFFIAISGVFISKLAVDPLVEYATDLQSLSKETLHELNLPISTIKANSQMLRKNIDADKSIKRLDRIDTACDMLKERYDELDYMIKMQSKHDVKETFRVDKLVLERVSFLAKLYPHIEIVTRLEPLEIKGDKKGLRKAIDNIVDNGVKYSLNSKKIDIQIVDEALIIQDYGIGMDEVELLQIFDKYYQSNKEMQGFGIGLNMVKRYCDANDIELRFISTVHVGTTVTFKFKTK